MQRVLLSTFRVLPPRERGAVRRGRDPSGHVEGLALGSEIFVEEDLLFLLLLRVRVVAAATAGSGRGGLSGCPRRVGFHELRGVPLRALPRQRALRHFAPDVLLVLPSFFRTPPPPVAGFPHGRALVGFLDRGAELLGDFLADGARVSERRGDVGVLRGQVRQNVLVLARVVAQPVVIVDTRRLGRIGDVLELLGPLLGGRSDEN